MNFRNSKSGKDKHMKLTFLTDNKTEDVRCRAEWGLSILIETEGHKYLYDTGASGMFAENAAAIGAVLTDVEACMISHGHYDHTQGVPEFVKLNDHAPVYIHKDALHESYAEGEDENCGMQWPEGFAETNSDRLVLSSGVTKVSDRLTLVGDIPSYDDYPPTEKFFMPVKSGMMGKLDVPAPGGTESVKAKRSIESDGMVQDTMNHEQFLVVDEGDRIHIISGCCHKGAVPTIRYAKELFPGRRIASFTGGMHTYMFDRAAREKLAAEMSSYGVEKVLPLHCTGMNMIVTFKEKMGDACIVACAGDTVEL